MMPWVMVAVALLGFALAFGTQSVGVLAFGLLLGFGGLVGALLAFAAARVESTSQSQSSRELSMILEARKHKAARAGGGGATPSVGYVVAGGDGRGKSPSQDERTHEGADGGSDGGGDGGGGGD